MVSREMKDVVAVEVFDAQVNVGVQAQYGLHDARVLMRHRDMHRRLAFNVFLIYFDSSVLTQGLNCEYLTQVNCQVQRCH